MKNNERACANCGGSMSNRHYQAKYCTERCKDDFALKNRTEEVKIRIKNYSRDHYQKNKNKLRKDRNGSSTMID